MVICHSVFSDLFYVGVLKASSHPSFKCDQGIKTIPFPALSSPADGVATAPYAPVDAAGKFMLQTKRDLQKSFTK